ncbi:transmembrane emp24 domain-containing protein 5-like [Tigriopus californicus]|uniref:transmembrane emp24 domain-containing protein 5-like n=1 Tax=Tigriopus californicus TaxID=6832 RepID=UPI0027DA4A9E|nr:transmembrane emp24 domain-containing protein 5-like [Tigriopus californicus]
MSPLVRCRPPYLALLLIWSYLAASWTGSVLSLTEREFTVEVPGGQEECFYESVQAGDTLDIDYQVVDGGRQNEMEISFRITRPDGVPLVADVRKSDNTHRNTVKTSGDYQICFDNTHNRFSPKIIFFEIIIEKEGEDEEGWDEFKDLIKDVPQDLEHYDMQVKDIEDALRQIKDRVSRSRHFQDQIRAFEFRDRSIAEHNFERVNFWSVVQFLLMVGVGITQVVMVRSLFDEKSYLHGIWKRFC